MSNFKRSKPIVWWRGGSAAALTGVSILVMFSGSMERCRAGITVGDKPPEMSEAQYYQIAVDAAEKDLERKKEAGQKRYDQKMALRARVINGMKSQLEARRRFIDVAPVPAAVVHSKNQIDCLGCVIWTLAFAVMGVAGWQFWRSRQTALGTG